MRFSVKSRRERLLAVGGICDATAEGAAVGPMSQSETD